MNRIDGCPWQTAIARTPAGIASLSHINSLGLKRHHRKTSVLRGWSNSHRVWKARLQTQETKGSHFIRIWKRPPPHALGSWQEVHWMESWEEQK